MTKATLLAGTVPDKVSGNGDAFKEVTNEVKTLATDTDEGTTKTASGDAAASTTTATETDDVPEDQLPKRLRGKSGKERVEVFKTVESELGRKNNEIGQLRAVIDEMLRARAAGDASSTSIKTTKAEPVTAERLLNDPAKTVAEVAERAVGEQTGQMQERLDRIEFEQQQRTFEGRFPKFQETMADEGFLDWVKESPLRGRLAAATVKGSWDAAHELFGLYEEAEKVRKATVTTHDPNAAKEGAVTRPGNGNTTGGAAKKTVSGNGKKIFSKSELRNLYITNRDAYNLMGDEIRQAYAEGRVR